MPADVCDAVMRARQPTVQHIPARARSAWAELIAAAASDAVHRACTDHTPAVWVPLLRLALLRGPVPPDATVLRRRFRQLLAGEYRNVLAIAQTAPRARRGRRPPAAQRARYHASRGCVGKAVRQLADDGAAWPDPTSAEVAEHFPRSEFLPTPFTPPARVPASVLVYKPMSGLCRNAESPRAWVEMVRAAVAETSATASPGPSGVTRPLLELAMATYGPAKAGVCALVDAIVSGSVCDPLTHHFRLVAVPKPKGGGIRPIGMGDVVRTTAMRLVARRLHEEAAPELVPEQLLLLPDGASKLHIAVSDSLKAGRIVLSMDIRRAFSFVERAHVLEQARGMCGDDVYTAIEAAYSGTPLMWPSWSSGDPVVAERGVVQGCPLGSALFAIAIRPIIRAAMTEVPGVWATAYADDVYATSDNPSSLARFFKAMERMCAVVGLELNSAKSVWAVSSDDVDIDWADDGALGYETLRALCPRTDIVDVGGAPLGVRECARREWRDAVRQRYSDAAAQVLAIGRFADPQHAAASIRHCGMWPRMRHMWRLLLVTGALSPEEIREMAVEAEAVDMSAFATGVLGPYGQLLSPSSWSCACRPISRGGLGLQPPSALVRSGVLDKQVAAILDPSAAADAETDVLSHLWDRVNARHRACDDKESQARLANLGGPCWTGLTAASHHDTLLSPLEASTAYALHLGLCVMGVPAIERPPGRCRCRGGVHDRLGLHAITCPLMWTQRHNGLRDWLAASLAPAASEPVRREQACTGMGQPVDAAPTDLRPGDVAVKLEGATRWSFVDLCVVSPSDARPTKAADAAVRTKCTGSGAEVCRRSGATFVAVALSIWGTLASTSGAWLRKVGSVLERAGKTIPAADLLNQGRALQERLSLRTVAANARSILSWRAALACASWDFDAVRDSFTVCTQIVCARDDVLATDDSSGAMKARWRQTILQHNISRKNNMPGASAASSIATNDPPPSQAG